MFIDHYFFFPFPTRKDGKDGCPPEGFQTGTRGCPAPGGALWPGDPRVPLLPQHQGKARPVPSATHGSLGKSDKATEFGERLGAPGRDPRLFSLLRQPLTVIPQPSATFLRTSNPPPTPPLGNLGRTPRRGRTKGAKNKEPGRERRGGKGRAPPFRLSPGTLRARRRRRPRGSPARPPRSATGEPPRGVPAPGAAVGPPPRPGPEPPSPPPPRGPSRGLVRARRRGARSCRALKSTDEVTRREAAPLPPPGSPTSPAAPSGPAPAGRSLLLGGSPRADRGGDGTGHGTRDPLPGRATRVRPQTRRRRFPEPGPPRGAAFGAFRDRKKPASERPRRGSLCVSLQRCRSPRRSVKLLSKCH